MVAKLPPVSGYRPDIDGLRAVAVVAVVLFHTFPPLLPGGFIGVDIFFVISGYLIGGILIDANQRGTFTYRDFYARRVRRLFPALAPVLLFVLIAGFFILSPSSYSLLGKHIAAGAGFISNLVLMREAGYFDVDSAFKPLLHLWSLGIEEQFYIITPLIIALVWRLRLSIPGIIAAFALLSFLAGIAWLDKAPTKAFYHPAARFWELFAGIVLAAQLRKPIRYHFPVLNPDFAALIGLGLLAFSFAFVREGDGFPGWLALLPVIGALLLIGPAAGSRISNLLLANRFMIFIGLISYPLYLWHWPLLSLARIHADKPLSAPVAGGLALLAVLLAWLTWRFIEPPLRHPRNGLPATKLLLFAMILLALAGWGVFVSKGLAIRYPEAIRAVATFNYNGKEEARAGRCFMKTEQTHNDFASECMTPAIDNAKPRILLWGDSHAAHLYPGLSQLATTQLGFTLWQLTASGCPPIPNFTIDARPACRSINDFVWQQIIKHRPDVVILAGFWKQYDGNGGWNKLQTERLQEVIFNLHANGIQKVIIVGQVPVWIKPQPELIVSLWEQKGHILDYTADGLVRESLSVDQNLRNELSQSDVIYVSPIELFCRDNECMTFSGPDRQQSVAFDYGHLTPSGSLSLAKRIHSAIFQKTQP